MNETPAVRARARWTDLASLGFALAGLGPVLLLAAVLAWDVDTEGELGFFAVIVGIATAAAFAVRTRGRWGKIAAILLAVLMMGGLWWTIFGLFAGPASFFDFMPGLLVLPGTIMGLVGSIRSMTASRRGDLRSRPEGGERTAMRAAAGVVAFAAVLSATLTLATRSTVADASAAQTTVRLDDFDFVPQNVSAAGGSTVFVRNDDPFLHTFTVDALGIDEALTPGSEKLISIPDEPGTYVLYCVPHTSDPDDPESNDMAGTLRVT